MFKVILYLANLSLRLFNRRDAAVRTQSSVVAQIVKRQLLAHLRKGVAVLLQSMVVAKMVRECNAFTAIPVIPVSW